MNLLALAGLLLMIAGTVGLFCGPDASQYAFAPSEEDALSRLTDLEKRWDGTFPAVSLHGLSSGVSVSAGEKSQGAVCLYQVEGNFFQTYPRTFLAGRPLARGDHAKKVMVVDEKLAFLLFGDQDPLGKTIRVQENDFRVVGVAAYSRRIGETGDYTAWIPMGCEKAPPMEIQMVTAGGKASDGERTVFKTTAAELFGSGDAIDLYKEKIRGSIVLLFLLAVIGLRLMAKWMRALKKLCRKWFDQIREKLKLRYPRQMLGTIFGKSLGAAFLWAVFLGISVLMVMAVAELMMVFPEWVPEQLLSASAVGRRFWELTGISARPIHWQTPELAEIRFWSGLVRWGVLAFLAGTCRIGKYSSPKQPESADEAP